MKFRNALICILIAVSFTSCTLFKEPIIESHTRYPSIPDSLLGPFDITPIPESETITILEGLKIPVQLRVNACDLAFRVIEIVRHATGGEVIVKSPGPSQCPENNLDSVPIPQP